MSKSKYSQHAGRWINEPEDAAESAFREQEIQRECRAIRETWTTRRWAAESEPNVELREVHDVFRLKEPRT
jgi:hypothetical protein